MALRCPRCETNEMVLETFGVFQCPACGRIDADGNPLDGAAPRIEVARSAPLLFAPPPPSVLSPAKGTDPRVAAEAAARGGPPGTFFWMIGLMVVLALVNVAITHDWGFVIGRAVALGFLASGKPWSRWLAIFGTLLECVIVVIVLAAAHAQLPPPVTLVLALGLIADAFWIYVLFQPATVRYFHPHV